MKACLVFVMVALAMLGACSSLPPESIDGQWSFVELTVDGETQEVAVGENAREQPWVEMFSGVLRGSSGCNGFQGGYEYEDGILVVPGVTGTRMFCVELMQFESAFYQLTQDPLTVSMSGNRMIWTGTNSSLILEEGLPEGIPFPSR